MVYFGVKTFLWQEVGLELCGGDCSISWYLLMNCTTQTPASRGSPFLLHSFNLYGRVFCIYGNFSLPPFLATQAGTCYCLADGGVFNQCVFFSMTDPSVELDAWKSVAEVLTGE